MMQTESLQLKWMHSFCRGNPSYISEKILMIPFDFAIQTCDLEGKNLRSTDKPGVRIGCATAMPELGVIALSERKEKGDIFIMSYPDMNIISQLHRGDNEEYLILQFTGCEYLVTLSIRNEHEIDLWNWSNGQRLCSISDSLTSKESSEVSLSVNPFFWYELCLQSNTKISILNIKCIEDKPHFTSRNLFLEKVNDDNASFKLTTKRSVDSQSEEDEKRTWLDIACHCWLSKDSIIVETSSGLLKVNPYEFHVAIFPREVDSKYVIASMTLSKLGLFVGYKTGFIDIVNISRGHWFIIETIKVGHPIKSLQLSPLYDVLAITTSKGSVYLYDTNDLNLHEVLRSDCAGEIGICVIEPLSQYCLVAKKTGCLYIFRISNGSLMSAIQLEEDIRSIASSPLCSFVVIGSNSGLLNVLDVTDPKHPKVVHCEWPYEAPVEHLKFENFGQMFATYAPDHHINLWNGLPSSNFEFLGSIKFSEEVKDICMFRRKETECTTLLILSESGASSEKEAGNILIRLNLPEDFLTNSKKYHMDIFKKLSYDALYCQKWRLNYPCSKMDIHINMGVVFYSPIMGTIQKFSIWNSSNSTMTSILKCNSVSTSYVSTNQRWVGIINGHGYLQLYNSEQMKLTAVTPKSVSNDIVCRHFLGMNVLGNRLMTGSESGYILCYKWGNDFPESKVIPEWVVYCHTQSERENCHLRNMYQEESADLKMSGVFPKSVMSLLYEELLLKLQTYVAIVNFKLYELLENEESVTEEDFEVNAIVVDGQSLQKLSDQNNENFFSLVKESSIRYSGKEGNITSCSISELKVVNTDTSGYAVHNYSEVQYHLGDHINNNQFNNNSYRESKVRDKANAGKTDLKVFSIGFKFKSEEERFDLIDDMKKIINDWKQEFNHVFDNIYEEKESVMNSISDIVEEMKCECSKLPSEAERDFWNAFMTCYDPEPIYSDFATKSSRGNQASDVLLDQRNDQVLHSTNSIENMKVSVNKLRLDIDLKVERLFFKRLFCDYVIHFLELKISCVLMFTMTERQVFEIQSKTEIQLESVADFISKFGLLLNELREVAKNFRHLHSRIQSQEISLDCKIEAKCSKTGDKEQAYFTFRHLPYFVLRTGSENPFWTPNLALIQEDLSLAEQKLELPCPNDVDKIKWEKICNKRIRYIKLGIFLRHTQYQMMRVTDMILESSEITLKLEAKQRYCKSMIENMKFVLRKLEEKLYILMSESLESPYLLFDHDLREQKGYLRFPDLNKVLPVRDESWKKMRVNIKANQNLQQKLEQVHVAINTFFSIQREIISKLEKSKFERESLYENLQHKLEEQKKTFSDCKAMIDELLDDKWNIVKFQASMKLKG